MGINSENVHAASKVLEAAARGDVQVNPLYGDNPPSEEQVELIHQVRLIGTGLNEMMAELMANPEIDKRWASIGATHLQQGLMAIERAITKPLKF